MLLLSVSLLSLLLSLFTGLSFLHSYTCYVSTFLVPFIAHTLERKYMFLLCNGILVCLARTSGFCGGNLASAGLQTEEVAEPDHRKVMNNVVEEQVVMLQPAAAAAPVDPLYEAAAQEQEREDPDDATAEDNGHL